MPFKEQKRGSRGGRGKRIRGSSRSKRFIRPRDPPNVFLKRVSRRREKKKRVRREARVRLSRGKWFLRPRDPPYVFLKRVSRRREKKKRLRRDARVRLSRGKWFLRPRDLRLPFRAYALTTFSKAASSS